MLRSLNVLYETLYKLIKDNFGSELPKFDRGFRLKKDCMHKAEEFPYAFLDQPEPSQISGIRAPSIFKYTVEIRLIILTFSADPDRLFFSENSEVGKKDAVELAQLIAGTIFTNYNLGLPFEPEPTEWSNPRWTLGRIIRPRLTELNSYFQFPNIAGVSIPFLFDIQETGQLPVTARG